jgi:hypothetical protein
MMSIINAPLAEQADGFISQYEQSFPLTPLSVKEVENKDIFTRLVFLDTWIRNADRFLKKSDGSVNNIVLVENGQKRKPYTAKSIDYSEAFRDYSEKFDLKNHFGEQAINDPKVFGRLSFFDRHLDPHVAYEVAEQLRKVKADEIQAFLDEMPKSWDMKAKAKKAFVSFIVKRADIVSQTLVNKLFPNRIV